MSNKNTTDSKSPKTSRKVVTSSTTESLTKDQTTKLVECEETIKQTNQSVFEKGKALATIKNERLYLGEFKHFEKYCKEKWQMGCIYANRHIEAYECLENLKSVPFGTVCLPTTESHARTIANLTKAQQIEVSEKVKELVGDKPATAQAFTKVRKELFPEKLKEPKAKATTGFISGLPKPNLKLLKEQAFKLGILNDGLKENQSVPLRLMLQDVEEELNKFVAWVESVKEVKEANKL